jgi:hypothetical protein
VITLDAHTQPIDPTFHHSSHRHLLSEPPVPRVPSVGIDAVIVPAARPAECLKDAVTLAQKVGTGVVAMCSGAVTAEQAVALGDTEGVPVIAMDVRNGADGLPTFSTTEFLRRHPEFARPSDTSRKRNLALLLSRLAGWERVLFLDDDIYDVDPEGVQAAAGLLDEFGAVGLNNVGCPDNSVVCHVLGMLGPDLGPDGAIPGEQAQFIGIGGMAVSPTTSYSFFPNIYNQDWFFIMGMADELRVAVTGLMKQQGYNPFEDPDRARREELGDCLAEGLFWLLDHGLPLNRADVDHWRAFLGRRAFFIGCLSDEIANRKLDQAQAERIQASLATAWNTLKKIEPDLCVEYVDRWRTDRDTWRSFLDERPVSLEGGLSAALEYARWDGVISSSVPWPTSL